ncbi:MAG: hypothetical protein LBT73_00045 [Tannerellaceae bacterium]|jgi:hypothetical protein|nr:hypothetical protein [Tannerellaceae bacterium]
MKSVLSSAAAAILLNVIAVNAQVKVTTDGNLQVGTIPSVDYGNEIQVNPTFSGGGRLSFGDGSYVFLGEEGTGDTDKLWLHGTRGFVLSNYYYYLSRDTVLYNELFGTNFLISKKIIQAPGFVNLPPAGTKIGELRGTLSALDGVQTMIYKAHYTPKSGEGVKDSAAWIAAEQRHAAQAAAPKIGIDPKTLQAAFPEAVVTDENGELCIDFVGLVGILLQSVKELKAEVNELKSSK